MPWGGMYIVYLGSKGLQKDIWPILIKSNEVQVKIFRFFVSQSSREIKFCRILSAIKFPFDSSIEALLWFIENQLGLVKACAHVRGSHFNSFEKGKSQVQGQNFRRSFRAGVFGWHVQASQLQVVSRLEVAFSRLDEQVGQVSTKFNQRTLRGYSNNISHTLYIYKKSEYCYYERIISPCRVFCAFE